MHHSASETSIHAWLPEGHERAEQFVMGLLLGGRGNRKLSVRQYLEMRVARRMGIRFPVLLVEGRIQSGQNGGRIGEFRESGALHQLGLLPLPAGGVDQVIIQRPVFVGQR